jgi:AcrR family transcriptional regulator
MKSVDKRCEIMRVALELMAENGFHGVPMSLIAERAKVAIGTIYLYFPGKDALIDAVYRAVERRIVVTLQQNQNSGDSIRERFVHMTGVILRYLIENPREFRYIEQYFNSPYGISLRRDKLTQRQDREAIRPDQHDKLADLLEEGIAAGVIKDLPLAVLFSLGVGPLVFLARDHILGFVILDDGLIGRTAEACWDAIRR